MKKDLIQKKEKIRFLGIPVGRRVYLPASIKTYLFGIKVGKRKYNAVQEKIIERQKYVFAKEDCKELLIVNSDSIGDYILSRNFLREIKNSEKYKDYKIVLLGSEKYKDFAEYLDTDVVDKFLWMPDRPQEKSLQEQEQIRDDLHKKQGMKHYYDTIIFSSFNSSWKKNAHNVILSQVLFRENIIHNDYPIPSISCNEFLMYTHVYTNYNAATMFDFDLSKGFFEDLLEKEIPIKYPYIEGDKINSNCNLIKDIKNDYVAINPCAYNNFRMWHLENWSQIIQYLANEKKLDVILVCSQGEKEYCEQLAELSDIKNIKVFAGLSVSDLLSVLNSAQLYIGQDSGIFHVAAALNIRALCLSSGMEYFRFMNYPKECENIRVIFPIGVEEWINKNIETNLSLVKTVNCFHINALKVRQVKEQIDAFLKA